MRFVVLLLLFAVAVRRASFCVKLLTKDPKYGLRKHIRRTSWNRRWVIKVSQLGGCLVENKLKDVAPIEQLV